MEQLNKDINSLDSLIERKKLKKIKGMIENKESCDKVLERIKDFGKNGSEKFLNVLRQLKSITLNKKALNLPENRIEESLILLNQSIELNPKDDDIKENRFIKFQNLYVQKINENKYEDIPRIFHIANNSYKYKSNQMKKFLDINNHFSNYFENLHKNYKNCINNCLEYIRKGKDEGNYQNYEAKVEILINNFLENIEKDSNLFLRDKVEAEEILSVINGFVKLYSKEKYYIELKTNVTFKFAKIYLNNDNDYSEELLTEFLKMKEKQEEKDLIIMAYIYLIEIKLDREKYLEGYKISNTSLQFLEEKLRDNTISENSINNYLNSIYKLKMNILINYIEYDFDEIALCNIDNYINELIDLKEKINDIPNIEKIEENINSFRIRCIKKKLNILFEKKQYKLCERMCDGIMRDYILPENVTREIKQIKINCYKEISDDLIKQNKKEEFLEKIKIISNLEQELGNELGVEKNNKDLINIMLKLMEEKAEYFNKNNLYDISENISNIGLELNPNNINLLTEKSISNTMKGNTNKAIDYVNQILSIEPNNLSAILNKINFISKLPIDVLNKNQDYIKCLVENINETSIYDKQSIIITERSIDILIFLIKKYSNKISDILKDKDGNNIFPKLKLLDFTFRIKELRYNSSELLKVFYNSLDSNELITNNYSNKLKGMLNILNYFNKKKIQKDDLDLIERIEKIILNSDILLEIKVNILFLYTKMDIYFISQLKLENYFVPINFIEYLFKYRDEYSEFIFISLQVLLTLITNKQIILNDSITKNLFQYIKKNTKKINSLMIDNSDIEEYLKNNIIDENKIEFTFESLKENFKKKLNQELINKVFVGDNIDLELLDHLKKNGIDLEKIINNNKAKKRNNIYFIFDLFFNYINVNEIKTEDFENLNDIFICTSDYYIKDKILILINKIGNKEKFKNKIPINLLLNLSKELIKLAISKNDKEIETIFLEKKLELLTKEERINIIIDILFNFILKKKNYNNMKIENDIFSNLAYYMKISELSQENKNKIIKILKSSENKLKYDIQNILEIFESTAILENNDNSYKDKLLNMEILEKHTKDGYKLNKNTIITLNNLIKNTDNEEIKNKAISLINTNVINHNEIDIKLSENLTNMFLDEKIKLNKNIFDNLVICLMNIIKNCKLDNQLSTALYNNLFKFTRNQSLNKLELAILSLKIFTQNHYSFNKEPILNCLRIVSNEGITKSNILFKELVNIIIKAFNEQNLDKEVFNTLFDLSYNNKDLLETISLCLLNSLKFKDKNFDEVNLLIKWNIKKFESLITNNNINSNIIEILLKASFDIFSNNEIVSFFILFTTILKNIRKENNIEYLITLISENKIIISEYHLKIIEVNLDIKNSFLLLRKIIEEQNNLLIKLNVNNIIVNLYNDYKNGIYIIYKLINSKINFEKEDLDELSNYLYNNHNEDAEENLYSNITDILNKISNYQNIPILVINKLVIETSNLVGNTDLNTIKIFEDILLKNKIPRRYHKKIKNFINNTNIELSLKIEIISKIFLQSLKKGDFLTKELYNSFFNLKLSLKDMDNIKYILINKNINEELKILYYKKYIKVFSDAKFGDKVYYLLKLLNIVDFKDIYVSLITNDMNKGQIIFNIMFMFMFMFLIISSSLFMINNLFGLNIYRFIK